MNAVIERMEAQVFKKDSDELFLHSLNLRLKDGSIPKLSLEDLYDSKLNNNLVACLICIKCDNIVGPTGIEC